MRVSDWKYDRISFQNRWATRKFSRNGDWVIFGIAKWYAGYEDFCYKFCFFGFDFKVWFKREILER